tara:strand:+ start:4905 stop:5306 length:402 start_codon:yes stop_codon:yes gene_type:complete
MADRDSGLKCLNEFYRIFAAMELDEMAKIWSPLPDTFCHHPGWSPCVGPNAVMASWRNIMGQANQFSLTYEHLGDHHQGNLLMTTGREHLAGSPHDIVTTNLLRFEENAWKIFHHHSSPIFAATSNAQKEMLN